MSSNAGQKGRVVQSCEQRCPLKNNATVTVSPAQIDLAIAYLCFLRSENRSKHIRFSPPGHWEIPRPNCLALQGRCKKQETVEYLFREIMKPGWNIGTDYSGDHDDCRHSTKCDLWGLVRIQQDLMTLEVYLPSEALPLQIVMRRIRDASTVLRHEFPYGTRAQAERFHDAFERFLGMLATGELKESDLLNT